MRKLLVLLLLAGFSFACGGDVAAPPQATKSAPMPDATPVPAVTVSPCTPAPSPGGQGTFWRGDCKATTSCKDLGGGLYQGKCSGK
jgi:hypothetical protein